MSDIQLMVVTEKHGDRYYIVEDDLALYRTALTLLTGRFESGYWYPKPTEPAKTTQALSELSDQEVFDAIATGKLFIFSEQQILSCSVNPLQCGGTGGCSGATQEIAFNY